MATHRIKLLFNTRIRRILYALVALVFVILFGTFGYMFFEQYSFLDSLFMTVITVATVGYSVVKPLDNQGLVFTMVLIVLGLGTFTYTLSLLSSFIIEGEMRSYLTNYRQMSEIKKMENHVIICGFGRNGHQVATELKAHQLPFVIVEQNETVIKNDKHEDWLITEGDAADEETLIEAGVEKAKSLIITLPDDATNVYITMTARSLNPRLNIISRASAEKAEKKLIMAGANKVVMPEKVGGSHMATLVIKPDVVEFLKQISAQDANAELTNLEQILCNDLPEDLKNKTLQDLEIRKKSGANIIGYKTSDGQFIINPSADIHLIPGSTFFVLGTSEQIAQMKKMLNL